MENEMQLVNSDIKEVILVNENLSDIPAQFLNEKSDKIRLLNLGHNSIQRLYGLEWFSKLEELVLDNNKLDDSCLFPLIATLKSLTLNNNKLVDLNSLINKLSKAFPSLTYLSLLGNKACPINFSSPDFTVSEYEHYRCYIACLLPSLKFLDWKAVTTAERCKGCKLLNKPMISLWKLPKNFYTPLPKTDNVVVAESNAVVGTLKHKYIGKRSEGNRFICNKDL